MSAARAAARIKPVVVVKSGRMAQGAKAAATHTGALAGSDAVYDAAFPSRRHPCAYPIFASCSTAPRRWGVSNRRRESGWRS